MSTIAKTIRKAKQRQAELDALLKLQAEKKEDDMVEKHLSHITFQEEQRIRRAMRPNKLALDMWAASTSRGRM